MLKMKLFCWIFGIMWMENLNYQRRNQFKGISYQILVSLQRNSFNNLQHLVLDPKKQLIFLSMIILMRARRMFHIPLLCWKLSTFFHHKAITFSLLQQLDQDQQHFTPSMDWNLPVIWRWCFRNMWILTISNQGQHSALLIPWLKFLKH